MRMFCRSMSCRSWYRVSPRVAKPSVLIIMVPVLSSPSKSSCLMSTEHGGSRRGGLGQRLLVRSSAAVVLEKGDLGSK